MDIALAKVLSDAEGELLVKDCKSNISVNPILFSFIQFVCICNLKIIGIEINAVKAICKRFKIDTTVSLALPVLKQNIPHI